MSNQQNSNQAFAVKPLPGFGGEIVGLDTSKPIEPRIREALYEAWLENGILLFRGVCSNTQQLELSRCFGELEKHPARELWVDGEPYLIQLGGPNKGNGSVCDGRLVAGALAWHRDTAFVPEICKGAMLRLVEVPEQDGETCFADMVRAYAALPEEMKQRIEGLEAKMTIRYEPAEIRFGKLWKQARRATEKEFPNPKQVVTQDFPSVVHPLVIELPETKTKALGISPSNLDFVIGLSQEESDQLFEALVIHATRPEFTYSHRWAPNDAIIYDNRRCLHAARGYHPQESRLAIRTTLADSLHTGRLYQAAVSN